jgi:hypothetical protein
MAPSERASVKYHRLAGELAVAESHFAAALQFEPENPQLALNLATVRLASADIATNEKARADLAQLAEQSAVRLEALRAIASDALAHNLARFSGTPGGETEIRKGRHARRRIALFGSRAEDQHSPARSARGPIQRYPSRNIGEISKPIRSMGVIPRFSNSFTVARNS